jgi:hypothetical protein
MLPFSISVRLPGKPTVLVCCHPHKSAGEESLIPRGGGAFIAEVDGNLTCFKQDGETDTITVKQGKYREGSFAPMIFVLSERRPEHLKTKRGKQLRTVTAHYATEEESTQYASRTDDEEKQVLQLIHEGLSMREIAEKMGYKNHYPVQKMFAEFRAKNLMSGNKLTDLGEEVRERYSVEKFQKTNGNGAAIPQFSF